VPDPKRPKTVYFGNKPPVPNVADFSIEDYLDFNLSHDEIVQKMKDAGCTAEQIEQLPIM